ncbi:hypothetical protein G6F32_016821 [Rhizopus arrhizus]|nr:hypothetical protein G6F32_016821 [Rhizopus arrhizus]
MAEQSAATPAAPAQAAPAAPAAPAPAPAKPAAQSAAQSVFKPLAGATAGAGTDIDLIMDVPVHWARARSSNWTAWPASRWTSSSTAT